jgi:hemerythrin-like metal-binding protein
MKFTWDRKYSVGVKIFDEQHQHYLELANQIINLADADPIDKEKLLKSISEFGNYALYHLSSEEEYFKKYNYADGETHTRSHDAYRREINKLLSRAIYASGNNAETAQELSDFAIKWLLEHILGMDRQYAEFFQTQGIN